MTYTTAELWRAVYLASIREGRMTPADARTRANDAIAALWQCPAGTPEAEWADAVAAAFEV